MSVTTDELMPDEGHPEPDFPDRDPSPYDILREAVEQAVTDLNCGQPVSPWSVASQKVVPDLERAMYLAAGGAE